MSQHQNFKSTTWTLNASAELTLSNKMCIRVQPVCNACSSNALPEEIHECEFRGCNPQYMEQCTRFLCRHELVEWDCDTQGCGLNPRTIDDSIADIDRRLRTFDLPLRPSGGDSPGSHEDNHDRHAGSNLRGFDGDGTSLAHETRSTTEVNVNPDDDVSPNNSSVARDDVAANDSSATNGDIAANDSLSTNDIVAANDSLSTNDNAAANENAVANESVETVFDPDSVDLETFPRCRSCFLGRRRCDGQTPCDKCRQRRCSGSCRPITVELLRQYPARAERVLEIAGRNAASS